MSEPTPGPWTVVLVRGSYQRPALVVAGKKIVAECKGDQLAPDQPSIGEAEANANLIAQAPALRAEVERLRAALTEISTSGGACNCGRDDQDQHADWCDFRPQLLAREALEEVYRGR